MGIKSLCLVGEEITHGSGGLAIVAVENPLLDVSMAMSVSASWARWGQDILDGKCFFTSSMCSPEG